MHDTWCFSHHLKHITWRGSIRSCNYSCSYCPFAKKSSSKTMIDNDIHDFNKFADYLLHNQHNFTDISILLAPYGEGLIHNHYQKGIAVLSKNPHITQVSCQTNFSFNALDFLLVLKQEHAIVSKVALWASFHPSQESLDVFVEKVKQLYKYINIVVVVVGNPENLSIIKQLVKKLPQTIAVRVNAMDGLMRQYTQEEYNAFTLIDSFFNLELKKYKPDFKYCTGGRQHIFIDAQGNVFPCNRSKKKIAHIYDNSVKKSVHTIDTCEGLCDCFLSYSYRKDIHSLVKMAPHTTLRLLNKKKHTAIFLDIDGTLTEKDGTIRKAVFDTIASIAQNYKLYFVTALPYHLALKKCSSISQYFSGGVFAYGAYICDCTISKEKVEYLTGIVDNSYKVYTIHDRPYKYICKKMPSNIDQECKVVKDGRVISIVSKHANKLDGILCICKWNNWANNDIIVMGDSPLDVPFLEYFNFSVAPCHASKQACESARFHMYPEKLFEVLLSN